MSEEGVERRLTTILATDVVGYSRLMAADEAGTHEGVLVAGAVLEVDGLLVAPGVYVPCQVAGHQRVRDAPVETGRGEYGLGGLDAPFASGLFADPDLEIGLEGDLVVAVYPGDLLDEIDSVLEENAEEFVKNYVQKGGE